MPSTALVDAAQAHFDRYELAATHGGKDLRLAVKVHWKDATFASWDEALAELAAGVVVTVHCSNSEPNPQRRDNRKHRMRFNPDGTITLLNHPDYEANQEAELMLAALSGAMCSCVAAAVHLPVNKLVPRGVDPMSHNAINDRLRALYTAVAWAQHPDTVWSAEFGQQHLRFGVTPRVVAEWSTDGWDPQVALRFQQQFASREVANRWRADGQESLRAAESAGRGEVPDEDARWVQAGFTPAKSARWRRWSFDPTEAYEWDSHNVAPSMVEPLGRQAASPNGVPVDVVKHWCAQGIPCTDVLAWVHQTNQDLDAALAWKDAKVRPNDLPRIRAWNAENPHRVLSAALIKPYAKAGVPSKAPELISQAIGAGITATAFKSAVDSLHEGDGGPLMEALRTRSATPGIAQSWLFRFDDPRFDDYGLRAVRSGQYPVLAKFVLDWLR